MFEVADQLAAELGEELPPVPEEGKAQLLQPPTPILRENNWPLLLVQKGFFEGAIEGEEAPEQEEEKGAWGEEAEMPETLEGDTGDVGEEVSGRWEGLESTLWAKANINPHWWLCLSLHAGSNKTSERFISVGWVLQSLAKSSTH